MLLQQSLSEKLKVLPATLESFSTRQMGRLSGLSAAICLQSGGIAVRLRISGKGRR